MISELGYDDCLAKKRKIVEAKSLEESKERIVEIPSHEVSVDSQLDDPNRDIRVIPTNMLKMPILASSSTTLPIVESLTPNEIARKQ